MGKFRSSAFIIRRGQQILYSPESYWFGDMVLSAELENYRSTSQMENGNSFIYRGIQY
jgi:hypothetical protein